MVKKLTPFREKTFNNTGHAICYRQSPKTVVHKIRHLENLLVLVLKPLLEIRYSSPTHFSANQYLNKSDCFGNLFLPHFVKIIGIENLWKMDPYLKSSFQNIFKILVSYRTLHFVASTSRTI